MMPIFYESAPVVANIAARKGRYLAQALNLGAFNEAECFWFDGIMPYLSISWISWSASAGK